MHSYWQILFFAPVIKSFATRCLMGLLVCLPCQADTRPDFPALTGRVVDNAHLLNALTQSRLRHQLHRYEQATSNQIIVVTLPSLDGLTIEEYAHRLERHWGVGVIGKDNGILLVYAFNENKVHLEVGASLKSALTDAISQSILDEKVIPAFDAGEYNKGVSQGATAIIATLNDASMAFQPTTYEAVKSAPLLSLSSISLKTLVWLVLAGGAVLIVIRHVPVRFTLHPRRKRYYRPKKSIAGSARRASRPREYESYVLYASTDTSSGYGLDDDEDDRYRMAGFDSSDSCEVSTDSAEIGDSWSDCGGDSGGDSGGGD